MVPIQIMTITAIIPGSRPPGELVVFDTIGEDVVFADDGVV
jgi:hypothetical protein